MTRTRSTRHLRRELGNVPEGEDMDGREQRRRRRKAERKARWKAEPKARRMSVRWWPA